MVTLHIHHSSRYFQRETGLAGGRTDLPLPHLYYTYRFSYDRPRLPISVSRHCTITSHCITPLKVKDALLLNESRRVVISQHSPIVITEALSPMENGQ